MTDVDHERSGSVSLVEPDSRRERDGMRVLFDVSHPALVHLFKHPIREFTRRGYPVRVASREKDVTTRLLDAYDIDHVPLSVARDGRLSRSREFVGRAVRLLRTARSFRPDVVVSQVDPAATQAARLSGARSVVFDDSEPEWLAAAITHPFGDVVCTPAAYRRELGARQRRYDGYHELAYLHPDRFTPRADRLEPFDVDPDERYFVVRFVSWSAHHDRGREGFYRRTKRRLVERLDRHGTVFVSSEEPLPPALADYRAPVPPERFHDLLAFADLYVGDSQTTATEAAILGTPAIRSNAFVREAEMGNFRELEDRYGLVRSVADERTALALAGRFARDPPTTEWGRRRDELLSETVDVASFVVDTIERVGAR